MATKKYPSQDNYKERMKKADCVRVTVWTHKTNAERVKAYARKHQTPSA